MDPHSCLCVLLFSVTVQHQLLGQVGPRVGIFRLGYKWGNSPNLPFPSGSPKSPGRWGARWLCKAEARNWSILEHQAISLGPQKDKVAGGGSSPRKEGAELEWGDSSVHLDFCSPLPLSLMSCSSFGHQGGHLGPLSSPPAAPEGAHRP